MAFEGFLGDLRARPLGVRMVGYAISLVLHLPPVAVFAIAVYTRVLVLDHALELPEPRKERSVYWEVPAHFVNSIPGGGAGQTASASHSVGVGELGAPRGKAGGAKRRSRRPLALPASHRRVRRAAIAAPKPAAVGPEELASDDGMLHAAHGAGTAHAGDGLGSGAADDGAGGGLGGEGAGPGKGSAFGGSAPAGEGRGTATGGREGLGIAEQQAANWVAPELRRKEGRGKKGRAEADDDGEGVGGDDEAVVGPPLFGHAARVSMNYAAYLRTYEPFPTLPESCWPPGRSTHTLLLEICVSERGDVSDVAVRESAGEEVDAYLTTAVRTWRYRPRVVQGTPRPFCHPIRLVYTRALRFGQRW